MGNISKIEHLNDPFEGGYKVNFLQNKLLEKSLGETVVNDLIVSREKLLKTKKDTLGILSLTTDNKNLLMWSHYTNNHKGYCLEFDLNIHDFKFNPFNELISIVTIYSSLSSISSILVFSIRIFDKNSTLFFIFTPLLSYQLDTYFLLLIKPLSAYKSIQSDSLNQNGFPPLRQLNVTQKILFLQHFHSIFHLKLV